MHFSIIALALLFISVQLAVSGYLLRKKTRWLGNAMMIGGILYAVPAVSIYLNPRMGLLLLGMVTVVVLVAAVLLLVMRRRFNW